MIDLHKVRRWLDKQELKHAQQESSDSILDFGKVRTPDDYEQAVNRMRVALKRLQTAEDVVNSPKGNE